MISFIVPAFCEEKQISQTLKEIDQIHHSLGEESEIILVDDGSTDGTYEKAQSLHKTYPHLRVIKHEKNQGLGAALRTGFKHSLGDKVVTLDCDLSFNPQDAPVLLSHLSDFDVVVGAQHIPGAKMENIPLLRIILSKIANLLDRSIFGGNLPSYTSMFVAYRGSLIRDLEFYSNSFAGQCEILVRLHKGKAKFKGIPVRLAWRDIQRKSSMNIMGEGKRRLGLWWQLNRFRKLRVF